MYIILYYIILYYIIMMKRESWFLRIKKRKSTFMTTLKTIFVKMCSF